MSIKEKIMRKMMGKITAEDMSAMMPQAMKMMGGQDPEKLKNMMFQMMPQMIEEYMKSMTPATAVKTASEILSQAIDRGLNNANQQEEREKIINLCRELTREIEKKFLNE